jgi:hypothetical protein
MNTFLKAAYETGKLAATYETKKKLRDALRSKLRSKDQVGWRETAKTPPQPRSIGLSGDPK